MGLPSVSMQKPVLVAMIFFGATMMGVISLGRLPVELYQGQNPGIVSIIVRARGGLPPPEVEKSITKPVEEAVATVSRLKSLYSSSREAESRVTMEFEPGTDMNFAALEVREKFSRVKPLLPKEIEKPVIANYDDTSSAIMVFSLTSSSMSPEDIRAMVDNELKPLLARVDGVASVEVYGGRERKVLVELDRDKMFGYNIDADRIMDVLGQNNVNLLAGNLDAGKMEYAIRTMGAFEKVEEIGELGVKATRQGSIIPLKEVATVKDAYMEPEDAARLNLEQNVTVYVKKTSVANTIPVVHHSRSLIEQFAEAHKQDVTLVLVSDRAEVISKAIEEVKHTLYEGCVLTVLLIYFFLRQWILSIIVLISLPVSVITTFVIMDAFGISLNIMTLSGLSLAHGILVDSSIVILENVFVKKERGLSDYEAIRQGAEEVWLPLLASLIATLIVFLPIMFIDKKIQMMYAGFAITVSGSLIVSFFVAQMLVPMLLVKWAQGKLNVSMHGDKEDPSAKMYKKIMKWNLKLRYPVALVVTLCFIFAGGKIAKMPIDHPSTFEENEFSVVVFPLAGARLEANDESVKKVEEVLSQIPDVDMFNSTVRKDTVTIFVRLKTKNKRTYSKEEIMQIIDQKGNELVKEIHDDYSLLIDEGQGGDEAKKLIINIFGNDNEQLEKLATEFSKKLGQVKGLQNIVMTDLRKRPEYSLVVDKGRAAYYGLTVKDVADSIHSQVRGMRPTKFHELTKGQEIETITRLQPVYRQKIEDLRYIYIPAHSSGVQVPLGEIANFVPTTGPQSIDRKDKYRYVFVKGDCKGALEKVAAEVKAALKDVKLPDDYYWRFGGSYETLIQGKNQLSVALLLTVFLVYMVMACLFESYLQPMLVMISVPMATIGIWLSLALTKKPLSENVFIGMILLAGYVVNAAIIMIDHMNHLKAKEGLSTEAALVHAGTDRLRPITMTTISTSLGFAPMAMSWGNSSELWAPLAVTVIGGLWSSTILTLFVLPNFVLITEDLISGIKGLFTGLAYMFSQMMKGNFNLRELMPEQIKTAAAAVRSMIRGFFNQPKKGDPL